MYFVVSEYLFIYWLTIIYCICIALSCFRHFWNSRLRVRKRVGCRGKTWMNEQQKQKSSYFSWFSFLAFPSFISQPLFSRALTLKFKKYNYNLKERKKEKRFIQTLSFLLLLSSTTSVFWLTIYLGIWLSSLVRFYHHSKALILFQVPLWMFFVLSLFLLFLSFLFNFFNLHFLKKFCF